MARWKSLALIYVTFTYITITPLGQNDSVTEEMHMRSSELANAINNFGYNLTVQLMNGKNNSNVVTSPTSIAGLLAMALLGSVGSSYDELSDKLGFSQDVLTNRKHHEHLGHLLENLNENDTYSKTIYADAIFVDNIYKLREVYRTYLTKVYNGEAQSVDFKDSVTVKNRINDWVSNNTNGKLPEFITEHLPIDTKVVLLSALYFNGQWETPFLPEYTVKLPFTTSSGDEVMIDQMLNAGKFKHAVSLEDGFEILAFPYNDSVTTLYALKSRKKSIIELMNAIDYTKINKVIEGMTIKECVIRFPKLDLQSDVKLENSLKALGIKSMFSPEKANFALMIENTNINTTEVDPILRINNDSNDEDSKLRSVINNDNNDEDSKLRSVINSLPNPGIYVDTVVHSVKITLDEYGTEASAATGAFLARTAQLFYLNSPFYIFIRNEKTQLITFSALILDPNN